jgi:probable rRNA maturation factor
MFAFNYFKIPRTLSRAYCIRALEALEKVVKKPQKGVINLIVVSSEEMAEMNQQFRGKEGPTDILTFSYYSPELTSSDVAGEIYLCLEKIKIYAEEAGKTYKEQLEYIIIHGLTHLMGYDHETDEDWQGMEKVEKKLQSLLK